MSVVVFSGPSLAPAEGRGLLPDARFPGPAGQGDIYDACRSGATVIALIDGYFEHRLAPWHKEILWALDRGVAVYGAASLGALRAAELAPFGMRGVGAVYQRVASGEIEDDDEVVLVHHGADRDYAPQSEALVDIRFTLEAAVEAGIASPACAHALLELGRSMFYPRRSLRALLERSQQAGWSGEERQSLARWLGRSLQPRVQQKRDDARALLELLATSRPGVRPAVPSASSRPLFDFAYTEVWHELRRECDALAAGAGSGADQSPERAPGRSEGRSPPSDAEPHHLKSVGEGLRLAGELRTRSRALHDSVMNEAALRALCLQVAPERRTVRSSPELQLFSETFRLRRGLLTPEETADWLRGEGLTLEEFSRFLLEEMRVLEGRAAADRLVAAAVPGVLHQRGLLATLSAEDSEQPCPETRAASGQADVSVDGAPPPGPGSADHLQSSVM